MKEIIFYNLDGTIKNIVALTEKNLAQCNGKKVRCSLADGNEIVGFADVYRTKNRSEFDNRIHDYFYLWTFDNLCEEQHKLIGTDADKYNQTFNRVNLDDIVKIEAILFSGPRWGTELTNRFEFSKKMQGK